MVFSFYALVVLLVIGYEFSKNKKLKKDELCKPKKMRYAFDELVIYACEYDCYGNFFRENQDVYVISNDGEIGLYKVKKITIDMMYQVSLEYLNGMTPLFGKEIKCLVVDKNFTEEEPEQTNKYRSIDAVPFADHVNEV